MTDNNFLTSEYSERRSDVNYTPNHNNINNNKKYDLEKDNYYAILENNELKENNLKLTNKLEELEHKLKEKNIDVII